jgi:hypothetical protein
MGILIAADCVGIGCAGWVLRAVVAEVADVLQEQGHGDLASWLNDELSPPSLFSHLDARDLTPRFHEAFLAAIPRAHARAMQRGPGGWRDPSLWDGYARLFSSLAEQVDSLAKGHPPTEWPNLNGIDPHSGNQSGPGWPAQPDGDA